MLSISSLTLTYLLAIPMGLYATARANKPDERVLSTLLYMLYSLPSFVAGSYCSRLLRDRAARHGVRAAALFGMVSDNFDTMTRGEQVVDLFRHSILPVTCYTYGSLAYYSRFVRANMQEVVRQDYIRTARAKGVGPHRRAAAATRSATR